MDDYMAHMRKNPPRCMKDLARTADARLQEALRGEYGDYTSVFGVRCSCGNERLSVVGTQSLADLEMAGPYYIQCNVCAKTTLIYDGTQHGYDGELGTIQVTEEGAGQRVWRCPECSGDLVEVAVGFQYNGEELDTIEEEGLEKRPEDLFGWFAAHVRCLSCGRSAELASVECA